MAVDGVRRLYGLRLGRPAVVLLELRVETAGEERGPAPQQRQQLRLLRWACWLGPAGEHDLQHEMLSAGKTEQWGDRSHQLRRRHSPELGDVRQQRARMRRPPCAFSLTFAFSSWPFPFSASS